MPYLIRVKMDGSVAEQWELTGKPFAVGRSPDVHGKIADSEASRQHFQIVCKDGKYWLEDKNSRNGTLVNGKRQATVELQYGDRLRAGETQFIFVEQKRTDLSAGSVPLPIADPAKPDSPPTLVNVRIPKALKKK